ncbi:SDR family NAD(P)-dependent oxidoreductase [Candidatus Binatia bacterium]|jgi:short-subunit dehydrogenase|nr:SDR family NAD(P)-dependent oxidoreductase [Candidatus Binatia bacterium]
MTMPAGVALVTGASSGIGAVYADRLARRGHDLLLVARDRSRLEGVAGRIREATGRAVEIRLADLTDAGSVAEIASRVGSDATISVLVNNAGISLEGGLLDNPPARLRELISVNITAPTLLAAAAGKAFAGRGAGVIINISSVLALSPELFDGVYSGSKAYLLNLSLKLARDVAERGVRVQAVLPGATRTEIWQRSGKDVDALLPGMVMDVDDLVDAALVGFDAGEVVTIPSLADEGPWNTYNEARLAMAPLLSRRDVAARYRVKTSI